MGLLIQTTGLEDYAPGGKARVKVMVIGGPGVGKTRWSSYFPDPIYADCEGGLASVADRKVPYVTIKTSQDMLDLLAYLKQECRQPADQRKYQTVVIDTLDAFQRKVKNEWMEQNRREVFTGWEAWGFLNSRMQLLLTRLLNLDLNVIVNVHFKDKTTKDDESGKETHTLMLQVQGEAGETAFNDFDLVAWMGTYWEAEGGERIQKRGLTFKATPDKPFLKDRLHVTPPWLEVTFAESDYTSLFERIQSRIEDMPASEVVGEVPSEGPPQPAAPPVAPVGTGPVPAQAAREIPLSQLDKPTLVKMCRDAGVSTGIDGSPLRGNALKSELIAALEAHAAGTLPPAKAPAEPAVAATAPAADGEPVSAPQQALTRVANARRTRVGGPTSTTAPAGTITVAEGTVDTATGEILTPATSATHEEAVATIAKELGGEVIEDKAVPVTKPAPQGPSGPDAPIKTAPASASEEVCEDCGKPLAAEKPDFVKLSWIKFRKRLCEDDYLKRKSGANR